RAPTPAAPARRVVLDGRGARRQHAEGADRAPLHRTTPHAARAVPTARALATTPTRRGGGPPTTAATLGGDRVRPTPPAATLRRGRDGFAPTATATLGGRHVARAPAATTNGVMNARSALATTLGHDWCAPAGSTATLARRLPYLAQEVSAVDDGPPAHVVTTWRRAAALGWRLPAPRGPVPRQRSGLPTLAGAHAGLALGLPPVVCSECCRPLVVGHRA